MAMLIVGLSVAYTVLRLIRICPALWAPPDTHNFFKLFCYQFHSKHPLKNSRKNFSEN